MNNGINLLDYKNRIEVQKNNLQYRKLRMVSIGLLFTVSTFSVMIFILIALSPLPQLNNQYKTASFNLSNSIADIVKLGLVSERTENIEKIINKRSSYDKIIENLQRKLPGDVEVESLRVNEKDVSLTVVSSSLLRIDDFLNALLIKDNSSEKLPKIVLTKLTIDSEKNKFLANIKIETL